MNELDGSALESLVRDLAADPAVWEHLVQHSPDQRHYEELRRDDDVAVWLICWMDDQDTGLPRPRPVRRGGRGRAGRGRGGPSRTRWSAGHTHVRARARRSTSAPPTSTACATPGARPAVTIHAYSPPLWRMGAYEVLPGGELRRHSLSYAEELRPLETDLR